MIGRIPDLTRFKNEHSIGEKLKKKISYIQITKTSKAENYLKVMCMDEFRQYFSEPQT